MRGIIRKAAVLIGVLACAVVFGVMNSVSTYAEQSFAVSPMSENVILNPGDSYRGAFRVNNLSNDDDFYYVVSVGPYYVDENYSPVFTNEYDRSRIVEWITIDKSQKGKIEPGGSTIVEFTVNVPDSAAAGGQYACISVSTDADARKDENGDAAISEGLAIGYTFFAEITGASTVSGEVLDMHIPSVLLGGKIGAFSSVKNTGNVHSMAKYTMKVYPLFSDTPVYDSSQNVMEDSDTHVIFPDRTYNEEEYWHETPMVGIFNVLYTVEYQGVTSEIKGMVIVCPWWLIVLVIIGLILMTLRIVTLVKLKKAPKDII